MQIHIAKVGYFTVNSSTRIVIYKDGSGQSTINDILNNQSLNLIIPDASYPNTVPAVNGRYLTLDEYLVIEANDGFELKHLDQVNVITYKR